MELKNGYYYWSIEPSQEAVDYGDNKPRKPWKGILTKKVKKDGFMLFLHRIDDKGNVDYDTNATAFVGTEETPKLYVTEGEARSAYIKKMLNLIEEHHEVVQKLQLELDEYVNSVPDDAYIDLEN